MNDQHAKFSCFLVSILVMAFSYMWLGTGIQQCLAIEEKIGWHGPYEFKLPKNGVNEKYENVKIIKRYDKSNADELKGLVPDITIEWLTDSEKWGPFYINETEYMKFQASPNYEAATEKYQGSAKLKEDGLLVDWVAGQPFKEPKNGWEVIWNYEKRYKGDDYDNHYMAVMTDKKGRIEHYVRGTWRRLFMTGRTEIDPRPIYPNEEGLELYDSFGYFDPYSLRGVVPMYKRYADQYKADDMWMYIPTMRRVRRMSTAQRMDSLGGGYDVSWDDFQNFSGKVMAYDWKLIERREALLPTLAKVKSEWVEGRHLCGVNDHYRRVKAYITECIPKERNHIYSKKVLWVDPESWTIPYGGFYDQKGKLWRLFHCHVTYDDRQSFGATSMTILDVQRMHSSNTMIYGWEGNSGQTPGTYAWDYLKNIYPSR